MAKIGLPGCLEPFVPSVPLCCSLCWARGYRDMRHAVAACPYDTRKAAHLTVTPPEAAAAANTDGNAALLSAYESFKLHTGSLPSSFMCPSTPSDPLVIDLVTPRAVDFFEKS